ncbi:MAG: von Willebrand factor type A domain-containing protein [Halocynthiibacter sp.]
MNKEDLDTLKAALRAAAPVPDADKKAAHLRLAEENFAKHRDSRQESGAPARLTPDRPERTGIIKGVIAMLNSISMKGVLGATTALAAFGLVAIVILPEGVDILRQPTTVTSVGQTTEAYRPATNDEGSRVADLDDAAPKVDTAPVVIAESAPEAEMATAPLTDMAAAAPQEAVCGIVGALDSLLSPAPVRPLSLSRSTVAESFAISRGDAISRAEPNTEAFANEAPNPLKITSEEPVSTFSIDVDTASYSIVRSSLLNGYLPDPNAVRIEEMVNYFPYAYPAPEGEVPFSQTVTVLPTPWNPGTQLVHIGIQGELPAIAERPPLNLVFLIDTSGSMNRPNKLPLLVQSFRLMLSQLRPEDEVAIVTYAGSSGLVLEPTPAGERSTILGALEHLTAGGSTAGQAGLQQAYRVAETMAADGEISRIILATDGDFNVGISDPEALKTYIEDKRDSGTYLSVLGFGRGNLDDATMQALAQNGNGQAAYIDTLSEAQKVLVDQLSGALFPIANDVKIQVEFNPAQIAEYRLIGYETRALRREDFNNDAVDAGEIGAGHSVTAIYEVTPVGSDAVLTDALRYAEAPPTDGSGELGYLKLRYKTPGADISQLIETPILSDAGTANADIRFATAIAGFGQLLRNSDYLGDWGYNDAIALASSARGDDDFGYRAEALTLMRLAETLASQ